MKAFRTLIFILLSIGLVWLLVLLFNKVFSTDNTTTAPTQTQTRLVSYAETDTIATTYIDGPVEADGQHESIRISVGRAQTKIELMRGYDQQVIQQFTAPNNSVSYANFLKSLDTARYSAPINKTVTTDERGSCPLRNRYIYTLENGTQTIMRAWSDGCGGGNFTGQASLVRQLFANQIPRDSMSSIQKSTKLSPY